MKCNFKTIYKGFIDFLSSSMNGMAFGLFATLIIGVIIGQIGLLLVNVEFTVGGVLYNIGTILDTISTFLKGLMGIGIGIGIAWALKLQGLKLISISAVGALSTSSYFTSSSNPLVAYIVVVLTITIVSLILRKKTPLDIIIVPLLSVIIGYLLTILIANPIIIATDAIGNFVHTATAYQPFLMGLVIAVIMGMLLTSPLSSAAIAIAINISGIAAGAALAGCCAQMVGFAVMGRKDNDVGTTISVAIGTSMLQFKNIIKKPVIWLPTIIASAILGPFATLIFKSETTKFGAGMGTSGLVGQLQTYEAMGNTVNTWLTIGLVQIIFPVVIVLLLDLLFRKLKWYKKGDLKI
jgi:uncharacterized protein